MRCLSCNFFFPTNEQQGECRESPPRVFMVPVRTMAGDSIGFQAIFPQCSNALWCGAYEYRESESPHEASAGLLSGLVGEH